MLISLAFLVVSPRALITVLFEIVHDPANGAALEVLIGMEVHKLGDYCQCLVGYCDCLPISIQNKCFCTMKTLLTFLRFTWIWGIDRWK